MTETAAREQVLEAGLRLVREGLIERTWGNISARVSDTAFVITPSGLPYEDLRPEQLAVVNIADGSHSGTVKPSSEKGIHADAYRLRPEVRFVIHTHQRWASVAGTAGRALTGFIHPDLGKRVPCAAYGLPGTQWLRRAVAAEAEAWPDCRAFLLRSHGALCLGRDMEDAFAAARALEEVCGQRCRSVAEAAAGGEPVPDWGVSWRRGDAFLLELEGERRSYPVAGRPLPPIAALHAALYRAGPFQYAAHERAAEVAAVSGRVRRLRPYLDDLAQIAGADVLCVAAEPGRVERAIRGRNAVLLRGCGALCAGATAGDVDAARSLLRKGCTAWLYAREEPGCRPLGQADALIQRLAYRYAYGKRKG